MKIYFEDGSLKPVYLDADFTVDASHGVKKNIEILDLINAHARNSAVYTNSILALNNSYAWNQDLETPEIYLRAGEHMEFVRIDKLTNRKLMQEHNLARLYIAGEFDKGIAGKLSPIKNDEAEGQTSREVDAMLYKIEFEVDNGYSYKRDSALIVADSLEEAHKKLRDFINSLDSETIISEIFRTEVFEGTVFTGNHGCK